MNVQDKFITAIFKFQVNPNIKFEVFIHKVDGLSDDHKIGKNRTFQIHYVHRLIKWCSVRHVYAGLYIRAGSFSARFRWLLSSLHESRYVEEMMFIRSKLPSWALKIKKNAVPIFSENI